MKKFKAIVPALAMLLVSAVLLGTSTFAWFSMNQSVSATGMQVTAKSESVWLQIANEDGASSDNGKSATAKTATGKIFPAKWNGDGATGEKWQTAVAAEPGASAKVGEYTDVADGQKNDYRLFNTFKISVKENTATSASNLKVTTCKVTGTSEFTDAIGVVVVCGTNVQTILAKGKTPGTSFDIAAAEVLAATVTSTPVEVKVYVYIDGDNEKVYTDNMTAANVAGIDVELTFGVD